MRMPRPVKLLAVRHGETAWNVEGRIQGHRDSPLTARGLEQARATAARLARHEVEALYCSDLGRARQTADAIAAVTALPVRIDPGLRERAFGIVEGRTWDEFRAHAPEEARRLREDPSHAVPGGESLVAFRGRVVEALRRIAEEADTDRIAVVTHGGVLGVLYREAMGIPLDAPRTYETPNAGVNHFCLEGGRWSLVRWGDADHLPSARDDVAPDAGAAPAGRSPALP